MKRVFSNFSFVALLFVCFVSCSDSFFEKDNQNAVDISTMRGSFVDLDVAVNGALGGFSAPACFSWFNFCEALGNDLTAATANVVRAQEAFLGDERETTWFQHRPGLINDAGYYFMQWGSWSTNMSNLAVETIEQGKIPIKNLADQANHDRLLGEGKLWRASMEWYICLGIGKQYHSSTLDAPAGIYRTWPIIGQEDIPKGRETVGSTYEKLLADLKDAQRLLPRFYQPGVHAPAFEYRGKKDVATAMLAKVYFQMNDFDHALTEINELLGNTTGLSTKYPLARGDNYIKMFQRTVRTDYNENAGLEIIMAFDGMNAQKPTRHDKWNLYRWSCFKPLNSDESRLLFRIVFGENFKQMWLDCDITKDIRYKQMVYVTDDATNPQGQPVGQWTSRKAGYADCNDMYLRSTEFHLMRAEIYLHKNDLPKAIAEVNLIRERAEIDLLPATTSKEEVMVDILRQRAIEMHYENTRRWDNLRLASLVGTPYASYLPEPFKSGFVPLGERDPLRDMIYTNGQNKLKWDEDQLYARLPENEFIFNPALQ